MKRILFFLCSCLLFPIASNAEFLTSDPAKGEINNPPSLHRYLYAYQNPTVFIDPDGRTAQQLEGLITAAIEGNRTSLGTLGEIKLEKILQASGEVIVKGPQTTGGQHNADIISYNPETKKITFFDNKIQTKKAAVSRASNLSELGGREKSIQEAIRNLDALDIDPKMLTEIDKALTKVADDPSRAIWAVANAPAEELSKVKNKVKRISQRLAKKGVVLANVSDQNVKVLSPEESVSNGRRVAKKFAKALPVLGTVATSADAAIRINAAAEEDRLFRDAMRELGISQTEFDNHSVEREAAILAGEEAVGTGGAAGGAAVVAPFSGACGFAAPLCIGAGALAGGLLGDKAGSATGAAAFDKIADKTAESEIERIKQQIRETRKNIDQKTMLEDSTSPGSF